MRLVRISLFSSVIVLFSMCNSPNGDAKFKEVRKPMNALAKLVEENRDSLYSNFRTNQSSDIAVICLKNLEALNNVHIPVNEIKENMTVASVDEITLFYRNNTILFQYKVNHSFFTTTINSWCYSTLEPISGNSLSPIHVKQITSLNDFDWYYVESFTTIAD